MEHCRRFNPIRIINIYRGTRFKFKTNVHLVNTYREIELPNNERFDLVHLFAVMNGIEYGGSYSSKFSHLVGWGGDTFQLFKDIKNEKGSLFN